MKIGYVGLGRMGIRMARLLLRKYEVVGYDIEPERVQEGTKIGIEPVNSLKTLASKLSEPRIIWLMVYSGTAVDNVINVLLPHLKEGDILIDGGNAHYVDSRRRRNSLQEKGIGFLAVGTSGGLEGATNGPPMTIDGEKGFFEKAKGLFDALGGNYSYFEEPGKGHLAKTIHNAIEYGMMQSIAEGVLLYHRNGFSEQEIKDVFRTWSNGSIIESKILGWLISALEKNSLAHAVKIKKSETSYIVDSILGDKDSTPAIAAAVKMRENPEKQDPVAMTALALIRNYFGGHEIEK